MRNDVLHLHSDHVVFLVCGIITWIVVFETSRAPSALSLEQLSLGCASVRGILKPLGLPIPPTSTRVDKRKNIPESPALFPLREQTYSEIKRTAVMPLRSS